MNILLSIKPEFVNKILSHEKLYEFRKAIFKQEVDRIYIYSTYPVKKIVGYFEVTEIICESPKCLWDLFSDVAGICENDFFKYYSNSEEGFAIKIDNLEVFDEFIDMSNFEDFRAPQSFCYIENNDCLRELLLA
jgi:type I restriction enzyme S subunit